MATEQPVLLDAGPDATGVEPDHPVRLLGYFNRTAAPSTGAWCSCSTAGRDAATRSTTPWSPTLLQAGYDVFRLNLRDHGPGIHLDPHAQQGHLCGHALDEAATAVHQIAAMAGARPFYIVGASMGGNFALRLAIRHSLTPFHNLARVVAISPAINPSRSTQALDAKLPYRRYFRDRWLASLHHKEELFLDLYDFGAMDPHLSVYDLTDRLVRMFGLFPDAEAYFTAYGVRGNAFEDLRVPTHIITAANDVVIPVVDFYGLKPHPLLDLEIHPTGGHVGFVDGLPLRHRLPAMVLERLTRPAGEVQPEPGPEFGTGNGNGFRPLE
ncbi:MAG: alpha/beta fold hydrolase [Caldilineaceae bacterium]